MNEKSKGYISTGVGEADLGPDGIISERTVTGRHVRIFREVNGIRVWGSRLMATYNLDGKPFRVEANWPPFNLSKKANDLLERDSAVKELAEKIVQEYLSLDNIKEMDSQLVYKYDKYNYVYEPVVFVSIRPTNDENGPHVIEYSLIEGLEKDDIIPEQNDADK